MTDLIARTAWLSRLGDDDATIDGLVRVDGYSPDSRPPEEVLMMEKAAGYGACAVFFENRAPGKSSVAQAFVFRSDGPADDLTFAALHMRMLDGHADADPTERSAHLRVAPGAGVAGRQTNRDGLKSLNDRACDLD
jgi:hypothetical protein